MLVLLGLWADLRKDGRGSFKGIIPRSVQKAGRLPLDDTHPTQKSTTPSLSDLGSPVPAPPEPAVTSSAQRTHCHTSTGDLIRFSLLVPE